MADVLPRHVIIGFLVFAFVISGGVILLTEFYKTDASYGDAGMLGSFNSTLDKQNDLISKVNDIKSNIETTDSDPGLFGVLNSLINGAWSVLRLLASNFSFMNDAFNYLTSGFGVPAYVPAIIIAIIVVVLAFGIWRAIFQTDL